MNRHKQTVIIMFLLIALIVVGTACSEQAAQVGSLSLSMQTGSQSRAIVPGQTPLEVARYIVMGIGPQGATFNVSATNKSVNIDGLLVGPWKIRAIGQNQGGIDLVEGSVETVIGPSANVVVIELDELAGKGTFQLTLNWGEIEIATPSTTVTLLDAQGNSRILTPTSNNSSNGSVTYQELLTAGSYTITAKLNSGSIPIAGFADFVRIVSNRTTESVINFEVDDYTKLPVSVTMVDKLGTPVECEITGLPDAVPAYEPVTVSLNALGDSVIDAVWYLDGVEIARAMECTFTAPIGSHRLDVLAQGPLLASLGSASISFEAQVLGPQGVPVLLRNISASSDGITIDRGCITELLPNNIVIVANNTEQTIHVCRIVRDSLEVIHSYTRLMNGYHPKKVTDIYYDVFSSQVIISDEDGPRITLYLYDPATHELTPRLVRNNLYYAEDTTKLYFDSISNFKMDQMNNQLYGLLGGLNTIAATSIYAESEAGLNENVAQTFHSSGYSFSDWDTSPSSNHTVLVSSEYNCVVIASRVPNTMVGHMKTYRAVDSHPYVSDVSSVCFIGETRFVYATKENLVRCEYTQAFAKEMNQTEVYTKDDGMGTVRGITQMITSPSMNYLYTLSPGHRALDVYEITPGNEELVHLKTISLGTFAGSRMEISAAGTHLIISSETSPSLLLFQICK